MWREGLELGKKRAPAAYCGRYVLFPFICWCVIMYVALSIIIIIKIKNREVIILLLYAFVVNK